MSLHPLACSKKTSLQQVCQIHDLQMFSSIPEAAFQYSCFLCFEGFGLKSHLFVFVFVAWAFMVMFNTLSPRSMTTRIPLYFLCGVLWFQDLYLDFELFLIFLSDMSEVLCLPFLFSFLPFFSPFCEYPGSQYHYSPKNHFYSYMYVLDICQRWADCEGIRYF